MSNNIKDDNMRDSVQRLDGQSVSGTFLAKVNFKQINMLCSY